MSSTPYTFPFGEPVQIVAQRVKEPKRVFILGGFGRAVHAQWVGSDGVVKMRAMAVASEPYIFWHGQSADHIIQHIKIPPELGRLVAAPQRFNGIMGRILDELYLKPLGLIRPDAWLCDLVPHSCQNNVQKQALERVYLPYLQSHNLATPTVPPPPKILADFDRQEAIVAEIHHADPEVIILLGDQPIRGFLWDYDERWQSLSDFGYGAEYGKLHSIELDEKRYSVLPLIHPRHAGRMEAHSKLLADLHRKWIQEKAGSILRKRFYY